MKTIKDALQKADQLSITTALEEILLAYQENHLDLLDIQSVRDILYENNLIIPGFVEPVSYRDRPKLLDELRANLDSEEIVHLLADIIQEMGKFGTLDQGNLQNLLSDCIFIDWVDRGDYKGLKKELTTHPL